MVEDLSKVNHIFCDKTGTLTKNHLIFRSIAFDGTLFEVKEQNEESFMGYKKHILENYESSEKKE